jgi:diguanylate cyclase (GGDEF)-like protein
LPRHTGHRTAALVASIATLLALDVPAHALSANVPLPQAPVQVSPTHVTALGANVTVGPGGATATSPTTPSSQSGGGAGAPAATAPGPPARTGTRTPRATRPGSANAPRQATAAGSAGTEPGVTTGGPGAGTGAAPRGAARGAASRPPEGAPPPRRGQVRQIIERIPAELLAALIACALLATAMSLVWLRERGRVRAAQRLAQVDPLTGIPNRLAFEDRLADEWKRARRYERPLGILLLDLDGLKGVNDRDGHEAGDRMIKTAASRMSEDTRQSDLAARLAGDEFVVLCPETTPAGLEQLGGKLTEALQRSGIAASVGWAALTDRDVAPGDLLARADAAMYQDKARRRAAPVAATARPGLAIAG